MTAYAAVLCACTCAAFALPAAAFDLELRNTAGGGEATLSLDDLDAMPQARIATSTSWTRGVIVFDGVAGPAIAALAPEGATTVQATALNDYAYTLPISDLADGDAIIATRRDGAPIALRDKGPYWIIYDFDSLPDHERRLREPRAVWHLKKLEFR